MAILRFCKQYLLSLKTMLALFLVLYLFGSAISMLSPYILGDFIDKLVSGANEAVILRFCCIFGGISIFKIIKDYFTSVLFTQMNIRMGYKLNMDVIEHIQALSVSFSSDKDDAYLNQRINNDCYSLISFSLTTIRDILIHTLMFIIPMIVLFTLNKLILAILLGFIFLYVVTSILLKNKLYHTGMLYRETQARFTASLYEQLKHLVKIKIHSIQPEYRKRADNVFQEYNDMAVKSQVVTFLYSSFDGIITTFAQIALFVVGGILVIRGKFTIGLFTVFSSYFRIMLNSCGYFFNLAASYQSARVSYARIKEILDQKPESNGSSILPSIDTIDLQNIRFSYDTYNHLTNPDSGKSADTAADIIQSFSYRFSKGKLYMITGNNGAGKTTLTKLLVGLYIDERSGEILYNSVPMKELDMIHIRKNLIGYSEQDPLLVEDSIRYNLTYHGSLFDSRKGKNSLDSASAADFNSQLKYYSEILNMEQFLSEKTLSFKVNEQNTNLSGGEKQKLSILRTLLKNPDVLILDEPTSSLDKETKERFIRYLTQIKKDKIIVIISHDTDLISIADEIINLSNEAA